MLAPVKPTRRRGFLWLVALSAAVVLAACGGDDDSPGGTTPTVVVTASPEERDYFQQLKSQLDEVHRQADALDAALDTAFDPQRPEPERADAGIAYGQQYQGYASDAQAKLSAIVPPSSLEPLHEAIVGAAGGVVDLSGSLNSRLASRTVATQSQFSELFVELDGVTLEGRFRDACFDLQAQATRKSAGVALECNRS